MAIDEQAITRTPAFVLDYERLRSNLEFIKSLGQKLPARFLFALKGFAMHAVFEDIASVATGATASSLNEALLAAEYFPEVHAYCPAYIPRDFSQIASLASHITFNSISQYLQYKDQVQGKQVALRVNPEYSSVTTAMYNPCAPGSRLGVSAHALRELPQGISGLHVHNLCESGAEALEETLIQIERLFGHLLHQISWINFGGGHLVTHKDYQKDLLIRTLNNFHARYPHLNIILEPSAAFVWETGALVAEVLDVVTNGDAISVMLDTSFAAHMPDCLEMPYTPRMQGGRILHTGESCHADEIRIRFGGSSCLAGDTVGDYAVKKPFRVKDRVLFEDMMHYTMVKTTLFNGLALPDIGIWRDETYQVIKTFSYEDYKQRLS
jgi:carboxynorspermidine decarboxylase